MGSERTSYEIARENLRQALEYLRYDMRIPEDMLRIQIDAILRSFVVREMFDRGQPADEK